METIKNGLFIYSKEDKCHVLVDVLNTKKACKEKAQKLALMGYIMDFKVANLLPSRLKSARTYSYVEPRDVGAWCVDHWRILEDGTLTKVKY